MTSQFQWLMLLTGCTCVAAACFVAFPLLYIILLLVGIACGLAACFRDLTR